MYEKLGKELRDYVDALTAHAQTALWPERRVALESFQRGIARSDPDDIKAAILAIPVELPPFLEDREALFRLVLTAYLEQLGTSEINNPDQADLYAKSLDQKHNSLAKAWFAAH